MQTYDNPNRNDRQHLQGERGGIFAPIPDPRSCFQVEFAKQQEVPLIELGPMLPKKLVLAQSSEEIRGWPQDCLLDGQNSQS